MVLHRRGEHPHQGVDGHAGEHQPGDVHGPDMQISPREQKQKAGDLVHSPQLLQIHVRIEHHHAPRVAQEGGQAGDALTLEVRVGLVDARLVEEQAGPPQAGEPRHLLPIEQGEDEGQRARHLAPAPELHRMALEAEQGCGNDAARRQSERDDAHREGDDVGGIEVEMQRERQELEALRSGPVVRHERVDVVHLLGKLVVIRRAGLVPEDEGPTAQDVGDRATSEDRRVLELQLGQGLAVDAGLRAGHRAGAALRPHA
mmetsp:Transcript_66741/g.204190  ORF Transcript_66741/g.204190 Transcript_66741/m.204190 type:complete len:258 (-) Transcript_66741:395-1168(-)